MEHIHEQSGAGERHAVSGISLGSAFADKEVTDLDDQAMCNVDDEPPENADSSCRRGRMRSDA